MTTVANGDKQVFNITSALVSWFSGTTNNGLYIMDWKNYFNDGSIIIYGSRESSYGSYINYTCGTGSNPNNVTLDISNDGDVEFNHTGDFTTNNQTIDFSGEINAYLSTCTAVNGNCTIPINITTASAGIVQINNINIVYMTYPNVTLKSPTNAGVYRVNTNVLFNCTATSDTDPLYNISLWHNITGTWSPNMTASFSGVSNYSNWTLTLTKKGKYIYNCHVFNVNGSNYTNSFALSNYSFEIDATQPSFINNATNGTYKFNTNFTSNITMTDNLALNFTWFYSNETGSWVNQTPKELNGVNTYIFNNSRNITLGYPNNICWKVYVNDSSNNINESTTQCFSMANTEPTIDGAYINDTSPQDDEDMNCTIGNVKDVDGNTIVYYYDWLKGDASQGINVSNLSSAFTTTNDLWKCRIWVGDTFNNGTNVTSAGVSIGTSYVAPSINFTNATTMETKVQSDSLNPTNNNSYIYLSVAFNDTNTGENYTAFFCNANSFSNGNCSSGFLCSTLANYTNSTPKCFLNVTNYASGLHTYYSFVLDNTSLVSASKSGTYFINTYPERAVLTSPANNSFVNKDWANLEFYSSDLEDTLFIYTIYGNETGSWHIVLWQFLNTSTAIFNYTDLPENKTIYLNISVYDVNGYLNPLLPYRYQFTTDYSPPDIIIHSPANLSTYSRTGLNVSIVQNITAIDKYIDSCYYNVTLSGGGLLIPNTVINCTNQSNLEIEIFANNLNYNFFVNDSAGNSNQVTVIFSTALYSGGTGEGGGGGGGITKECFNDGDCVNKWGVNYYCSNEKCLLNETKLIIQPTCGDGVCQPEFQEDLIQCPQDCPYNATIITSCFDEDIDNNFLCIWKQKWFLSISFLLLLLAIIYLIYYRRKKNG